MRAPQLNVIDRVLPLAVFTLLAVFLTREGPRKTLATAIRGGPYSSQPLALSRDDSRLIVANPDNNTVSIFVVEGDQNYKMAEVPVGREPNGVAFTSDATGAYVANTVDGTVSVLSLTG